MKSPRNDLIPSNAQRVSFNQGNIILLFLFFYKSPSLSLTNVGRVLAENRQISKGEGGAKYQRWPGEIVVAGNVEGESLVIQFDTIGSRFPRFRNILHS